MRTYQVQGRLIERRDGRIVRDDVRLADAGTWVEAIRAADAMTAEGFAVWVWGIEPRPGGKPASELLVVRDRPPGTSGGKADPAGGTADGGR